MQIPMGRCQFGHKFTFKQKMSTRGCKSKKLFKFIFWNLLLGLSKKISSTTISVVSFSGMLVRRLQTSIETKN